MLGSHRWAGHNEVNNNATTFLIVDNILLESWDLCIIVAILTLIFIGKSAGGDIALVNSVKVYRTCVVDMASMSVKLSYAGYC